MRSTMKDIARETGLSLATLSKYFNGGQVREQNRKRIEAAVKKFHYVPNEFARGLKTQQSRTVGVVIPELGNAFITSIITTMEDILREQDYAVIICDCRSDPAREKKAVDFLIHKQVDGLINMPTDMTGDHLRSAMREKVPVVLIDRLIRNYRGMLSAVIVDNVAAVDTGVRFLLEQGHRSIGLILGSQGLYTTQQRHQGYLEAMADYGEPLREDLLRYGEYTLEGGYEAAKQLMALKNRPTALFVTNFEMTLGVTLALHELGERVPEDISVVGFDKLDMFGACFGDLTVVKQPQNAIAEQTARLILSLMTTPSTPAQTVTLSTQLCEGSTVKPFHQT